MSAPSSQSYDDPFHNHLAHIDQHANRDRPHHCSYHPNDILQMQPHSQSQPSSQTHSPIPTDESFFYEAFRPTPSPPPAASFLDSILNPIESQSQNPFRSRVRDSLPRQRQRSPIVSIQGSMPSTRQRNERPTHLPYGYVDLTSLSESPDEPRRPRRQSLTPGPSAKRRKQNDGNAVRQASTTPEATTEDIDFSGEQQTVQDVLQKQREEAVKAQQKPEESATTFNTFTCVICMDTPKDLTATACGHLFCHTCLMEALIAGENRAKPGEPQRSQCPVCRKFISRKKASDVIPLLLKKGLATQPRKKSSTSALAPKVTI